MKIIWEFIKSRHAAKLLLSKDSPQEESVLKKIDDILGNVTVDVGEGAVNNRALISRHFINKSEQTIFFHKWAYVPEWSTACEAIEKAIIKEFPLAVFENTPKPKVT